MSAITITLPTPTEVETEASALFARRLGGPWDDVVEPYREEWQREAWDHLVLVRARAADPSSPSPALAAYLALEGAMLALDALSWGGPAADAVREIMDPLWRHKLTAADRATLTNRKAP